VSEPLPGGIRASFWMPAKTKTPETGVSGIFDRVDLRENWIDHLPVQALCSSQVTLVVRTEPVPAMPSRVAPTRASFGAAGAAVCGSPRCCALPGSSSRWGLQVSPHSSPSGCTGGGPSSCPESPVLRRLRCLSSRLPSNSALRGTPPDEAASFPARFILRFGLGIEFPGCPGAPLLWRRLMDTELPRCSHLPASPPLRLQVSLDPASAAGSMMTPGLLELCIFS